MIENSQVVGTHATQDGSADNRPLKSALMATPWTDPDPQSGDFDAELDRARSDQIEMHAGNPDAKLSRIKSFDCFDGPSGASSRSRPD
jgi:hypothetical protein